MPTDPQSTKDKSEGQPTPKDALEQAVELLAKSPESVKLIRFLSRRENQSAHLDDIAVGIDKTPIASAFKRRGTIRQRYRRAHDLLNEQGAPVRLLIEKHVVKLVVVPDPPEHATSV